MAGTALSIRHSIPDERIRRALRELADAGGDMRVAFNDIGEGLITSHHDRWAKEQDPDGQRWPELSDKTLRRKMLRGVKRTRGKRRTLTKRDGSTKIGAIRALAAARILVDRGHLRDTLRYQATAKQMELGTNRIYGATHQFGDPQRNIPERKWLGLSEADRRMIVEVLHDLLRRILK